jgi:hypothetical protein
MKGSTNIINTNVKNKGPEVDPHVTPDFTASEEEIVPKI